MKPHHKSWLEAHPDRHIQWFEERLNDGFEVHHLDGNHQNDEPLNLVLIEAVDHRRLHGCRMKRFPNHSSIIAKKAMAARTPEQRSAGASRAGKARWAKMPQVDRSEAARKAALTRWRKHAKKRGGWCVAEASKPEINQTRLLTHDQET